MKFKLIILSIISPFLLSAQTELTQKQIQEDFTIFKNILTNSHPSLYEYTTKSQWDSIFVSFEDEINQIKNSDDLFRSINVIADNVRDGHIRILHPTMETVPSMFPLLLKIIDKKLYTDTEDFDIPIGSEIISIDGVKSDILINRLLKYVKTDGYNLTKKYRQVESEFGILHYYEFGAKSSYNVTYITPNNQTKTTEILSQSFRSIGMRFPNRNSYFSIYHKKTNRLEYFKNFVSKKMPYVYFIDSINTATLTVNSFGVNPREFKSKLIDIFKEIKKEKAEYLIIDIRQNIGGYRINATHLFSFITDQPFKQRISESVITSTLAEQKYLKNTMSNYNEFFKTYFAKSVKKGDRWVLTTDRSEEMMKPYRKTFKGKVYVIIGGKTFSAGSAFALNVKNDSKMTLVGEETGGGYYFHTGQFPVLYELPNSKIMFNISLLKINHYIKDKSLPKGSGVLPGIEINLTQQDLIKGTDSQLDYIVKRIKKE
jgi:hypothetical protein